MIQTNALEEQLQYEKNTNKELRQKLK